MNTDVIEGKDLIFISRIERDGSGVVPVDDDKHLQTEKFELNCLSMTKETYIASGFNSYVVKLKKQ